MRRHRPAILATCFIWFTRVLLAYLFLTASLGGWVWSQGGLQRVEGKMADPQALVIQLRDLGLAPDPWNAWIAMGLPWIEALTGLALLLPWTALGGLAIAAGLLASFIAFLVWASSQGLSGACACFGGTGATLEDGGALGMALFLRGLWLSMALVSLYLLWRGGSTPSAFKSGTSRPSSGREGGRPQSG